MKYLSRNKIIKRIYKKNKKNNGINVLQKNITSNTRHKIYNLLI